MRTASPTRAERDGIVTAATRAAGVALAYILLANLGLSLQVEPGRIAAFWPPSGMLLAALLLSPRRSWGWTLGAVAIANVGSNLLGGRPASLGAAYAAVSCFEAYLGAALVVRACGTRCDLSTFRQVLAFLGLGAVLPYAVGGCLASGATLLFLPDAGFWPTASVWFISGGMGVAIVSPPLLTWFRPTPVRFGATRAVEAAALLAVLALTCGAVFTDAFPHPGFPLFYLTFPPLVWAAVRFGPRGAATATLIVFAFALGSVYSGHAFLATDAAQSVQWIQVYSLVVVVSTLIVGATWAERDAAQASLAESEERVALALEGANMGAWTWNVAEDRLSWSEAVAPMLGLPAGVREGTYRSTLGLLQPEDRDAVEKAIAGLRRSPRDDFFVEHEATLPGGETRWIETRGRVDRAASGEPVKLAGTVVDVTVRKQAQRLESLGLLAGGIAHDFNNLLQVILGNASILEEERRRGGDSDENGRLRDIQCAGTQAAQLARSLLSFSRHHVSPSASVDLNELVERTLAMLRRLIPESIEVSFDPSQPLPTVSLPSGEMEQAVVNLCLNARDAMPDGGRLRLATAAVTLDADARGDGDVVKPGCHVRLEVSDTGTGIERSQQARIFDPFFTTREAGGGTGLGLSVVQAFVTRVGGHVEVESEVGKGTTFRVFLPESSAAPRPVDVPRPPLARAPGATRRRVLVADDNDLVRGVARITLERAGFEVVEARDGAETLAVFDRYAGSFDLVLVDGVMPKKSGREVYEAISAEHPDLPFLFCSGYAAGTLSEDFFADPRRGMIAKPYRNAELLRAVSALLDGPSSPDCAEATGSPAPADAT